MAILQADANGRIAGRFTIPIGIRSGTKLVRGVGAGGTVGQTTFTGRGTLTIEERRRVTNVEEFRYDPLAQTFTLNESRHIAATDLWFDVAGTHDVIVQIRDTTVGLPGQNVLAETRVKPADILLNGGPTRCYFRAPIWLDANREYAIVVLTDDAVASLRTATLGKFDAVNQKWITGQAYQVGTLLSSSNASTWTAHQDKDLTFALLACRFTETARTIDLGVVNVAAASDFLARMSIDIPATGTTAEIIATAPTGEAFRMSPGMPIAIPSRVTGDVSVKIVLAGTAKASPVVYPGLQFIAGNMSGIGTYVTRAFPVGTNSRVAVTFEANIPGTSSVLVEVEAANGTWQPLTLSNGVNMGDGWVERTYVVTGFTAAQSRVRLTLQGTAQDRPLVRKLRAVATV